MPLGGRQRTDKATDIWFMVKVPQIAMKLTQKGRREVSLQREVA